MSWFEKYHLEDNLSYKSWWLITSFNLSLEEIEKRQKKVVFILENFSWIEVTKKETSLYLKKKKNSKRHNLKRIKKLLEENSILINAKMYLDNYISWEWNSFWDILNTLDLIFSWTNDNNFSESYDIISIFFWEICYDLSISIWNWSFKPTPKEISEIQKINSLRENYLFKLGQIKDKFFL